MKKRHGKSVWALLLAAVMGMTLLAGCGGSSSSSGDSTAQDEEVSSLNILVWGGMWSEEVFEDFTEETGIEVNISYIDNTDTMLAKLIEGDAEYDLIDLEAAYVQSFVEAGLLAEIDFDSMENIDNVKDEYRENGPIGDEDSQYTIADIGPNYTSVIYNVETCPIEITSFADLADPALEGEIAMVNSTISIYGAALVALGYSADSTSEEEIAEANELLKDIKTNVKAFVGEMAVSQLENGECSVGFCWDYLTLCNDSEDYWDQFEIVHLEGGCESFQQYWAIPSSSTKQAAATQLIDFMLQPEEAAKHFMEYGYLPNLKDEVIADYLPDSFYSSPAIEAFEELDEDDWRVAVNDEQISLMDTYYTELMGT